MTEQLQRSPRQRAQRRQLHSLFSRVVQAQFDPRTRALVEEQLGEIEQALTTLTHADPEGTERAGRTDMALGLTEPPQRKLSAKLQLRLSNVISMCTDEGEAELLLRANSLRARAEGRVDNNLRIFGDRLGASTWMDWPEVPDRVRGNYRSWFTQASAQPLQEVGGRFKFNLSGFDPEQITRLLAECAELNRVALDERVDRGDISKTDWELVEILSTPALYALTDWLLFDKSEDLQPRALQPEEAARYHVDARLDLLSDEDYAVVLARKQEQQARQAAAAQERLQQAAAFKQAGEAERIAMLRARYEVELRGTDKTLADEDVQANLAEAIEEVTWFDDFDEWWANGPIHFFRRLRQDL